MVMKELFDSGRIFGSAKINHFRNHSELTRKNLMVKNLKRLKKRWEKEAGKPDASQLDFIPTTFELPIEYHMFVEEFRKHPGSIWIMKPVGRSQGKGIFLFTKIRDIEAWKRTGISERTADQDITQQQREPPETYVVSRYITDPYLICHRKFDLRVYVLVQTYNPLKAWVYRCGFARFSNTRFSLDSINDSYVHLTNVAVQKTAPDYDADKGSKWSVYKLRQYLNAKYGGKKIDHLFRQIDCIFLMSLFSVQKQIINDKHCFELYGYDILLDSQLKPWLLEINASPSMTASSREDYELKANLMEDLLDIIDLQGRLTGSERRVGDFDLIWNDGPVPPSNSENEMWLLQAVQQLKNNNNNTLMPFFTDYNPNETLSFVASLPKMNSYLGALPMKRKSED